MPAPEAGVPYRNLSLNGAEHDQDQAQRSDLREYTKCDAETAQQFSRSQKRGEALAHADALAAGFEIFQMVPSAADEYQRHHEPEKKYTDVGILCELRKHTCTSAQATRPILLLRMVCRRRRSPRIGEALRFRCGRRRHGRNVRAPLSG